MLRLITLVCLIHISVGITIRGRILLNGDANQVVNIPAGSQLSVRLGDVSDADTAAILIKETKISNLLTLPINYQLRVLTNLSPANSYALTARITKGDVLLYINDVYIPVGADSNRTLIIDIPVIAIKGQEEEEPQPLLNNLDGLSWPELVGREGTYAVQYIKQKTGLTNVMTISEGSMVTMDYRTDRVRVFVDEKGIVTETPRIG